MWPYRFVHNNIYTPFPSTVKVVRFVCLDKRTKRTEIVQKAQNAQKVQPSYRKYRYLQDFES